MLRDLIGLDRDEFNRIRGTEVLVAESKSGTFAGVLTWNVLNELLAMSATHSNRISVVKEDQRLDRGLFTRSMNNGVSGLIPAAIRRALSEGHSLHLSELHLFHGPARHLADALIGELGEDVALSAFVSWRPTGCFLTHWDEVDVLVMQTEGEKEWSVFLPTRGFPMGADVEYAHDTANLTLAWNGVLRPGQVLYIPRGWWHHANTTGPGSIHISAAFTNRRAIDLFRYLSARAASVKAFRTDLPRPEQADYASLKHGVRKRLLEFFDTQLDENFLEAFWRHHYASLENRTSYNLPTTLDFQLFASKDWAVQLASLAPVITIERSAGELVFESGRQQWRLSELTEPILRRLATGDVVRVSDLVSTCGPLSAREAKGLLFELLNEGAIALLEPS